ncbi:MAG: hypothetical protein NVSMB9_34990 [Isosphaeraceae bacterium]
MLRDDPFLDAPIRRSGEWYGVAGNLKTEPSRREIVLVLDYCGSSHGRRGALALCGDLEQLLRARGLTLDPPDIDPAETLIRLTVRVPDAVVFGEFFEEIHTFLKRCKRSES